MFTSPGIKNADKQELDDITSTPTEDYSFFVNDFKILRTLTPLISKRVCSTTGGTLEELRSKKDNMFWAFWICFSYLQYDILTRTLARILIAYWQLDRDVLYQIK